MTQRLSNFQNVDHNLFAFSPHETDASFSLKPADFRLLPEFSLVLSSLMLEQEQLSVPQIKSSLSHAQSPSLDYVPQESRRRGTREEGEREDRPRLERERLAHHRTTGTPSFSFRNQLSPAELLFLKQNQNVSVIFPIFFF